MSSIFKSLPSFTGWRATPPPRQEKPTTTVNNEIGVYEQEKHRAGLLVTEELHIAMERCRGKVLKIAKECEDANRKYRDSEWDLVGCWDICLHGLVQDPVKSYYPTAARRVNEIFAKPSFFIDDVASSDIVQGSLGDCWFLSAIASVATKPALIRKLCVEYDEKAGVYGFIFFRNGEWVDVIVDDQLYTKVPIWEDLQVLERSRYQDDRDLFEKVARTGGKTLLFARSAQENETWVAILEKAYAKLHGDYAALSGGATAEGVEDLTGGISERLYPNDIMDPNKFWEKELLRANEDLLFSCTVFGPLESASDNPVEYINGLRTGHAYTVLSVHEVREKRFVKMRNPWGSSEWTGRWSDGSKEWTPDWLEVLEDLDHKFGDDGVFIMEYSDFLTYWSNIERTQLLDASWIQSSHWLDVNCRPAPSAWQYGDVSFSFTIAEASEAIVVLSRADQRFFNGLESSIGWNLDFKLFRENNSDAIAGSGQTGNRSAVVRAFLQSGTYIVHVRLERRSVWDVEKAYSDRAAPGKERKLTRVLSELARTKSLAVNFDAKKWQSYLTIPVERLGGRNVHDIQSSDIQAESQKRKTLQMRFSSAKVPLATSMKTDLALAEEGEESGTIGTAEDDQRVDSPVEITDESPKSSTPTTVYADMATLTNDTFSSEAGTYIGHQKEVRANSDGIPGVIEEEIVKEDATDPGLTDDYLKSSTTTAIATVVVVPEVEPPVHVGISCEGCKDSTIKGTRWKCLVCSNYDLCDKCYSTGTHEHQMLAIEHPEAFEKIGEEKLEEDTNSILLGLRVYTKSHTPVRITGQLRKGQLLHWTKNGE